LTRSIGGKDTLVSGQGDDTMWGDALIGNGLQQLLPSGTAPIYPAGPHCNQRGLTALGEHAIRRMIEKKMIVDPDHLSVLARNQVLSILDGASYSGVVSSHSWSTADAFPRIYQRGGFVAPYAGSSGDFVKKWRAIKPMRDPRYYWGIGYGADMNGFGAQGSPRTGATNPVGYPFKSFDGKVTIDKLHSGERVYDINVDGVAHYGLYPDWIQDLRMIAGDEIVDDLARGSESYLQMWERAVGVPEQRCQPADAGDTQPDRQIVWTVGQKQRDAVTLADALRQGPACIAVGARGQIRVR